MAQSALVVIVVIVVIVMIVMIVVIVAVVVLMLVNAGISLTRNEGARPREAATIYSSNIENDNRNTCFIY
mgnify:CR=1 FL=1